MGGERFWKLELQRLDSEIKEKEDFPKEIKRMWQEGLKLSAEVDKEILEHPELKISIPDKLREKADLIEAVQGYSSVLKANHEELNKLKEYRISVNAMIERYQRGLLKD